MYQIAVPDINENNKNSSSFNMSTFSFALLNENKGANKKAFDNKSIQTENGAKKRQQTILCLLKMFLHKKHYAKNQ